MQIQYKQVADIDQSFALVRTNPMLTGNLRITIDSVNDIWLNSMDANTELSNDRYKKYPIDITYSHATNIKKFFNMGKTLSNLIFDIHTDVNPTKTSSDYKDQYDFSLYFSGVKYLISKFYTEKFTYFAPLYLKRGIPDYFIIMKIDGPINNIISEQQPSEIDMPNYFYEMMGRSTIIKTFDLSESTKIGKYIRAIQNNKNFPSAPIDINFTEDSLTYWNGISIKGGVYSSQGENLYDFYNEGNTLKYFEDYITSGYQRNGIIHPNILNLEFLFDDETSANFDFNRYVGFYVSAIELDKFKMDTLSLYQNRDEYNNQPKLKEPMDDNYDKSLIMTNDNGFILPYKQGSSINNFDYAGSDLKLKQDELYIMYIQDKTGAFHSLNPDTPFIIADNIINYNSLIDGNDGEHAYTFNAFQLRDKSIDIGKLIGPDTLNAQNNTELLFDAGRSYLYIKLKSSIRHTDKIRLYHKNGSRSIGSPNRRYDDIEFVNYGYKRWQSSKPYMVGDRILIGDNYVMEVISVAIDPKTGTIEPNWDHASPGVSTTIDNNIVWKYRVDHDNLLLYPGTHYSYYNQIDGSPNLYYANGSIAHGDITSLTTALYNTLKSIEVRRFKVYMHNDTVFIVCKKSGYHDMDYSIEFISKNQSYKDAYESVEINGVSSTNLSGNIINAKGGTTYDYNRLVVDADYTADIINTMEKLLVKTTDGWSRIKAVSNYADIITDDNFASDSTRSHAYGDFFGKSVLELEELSIPYINSGNFTLYNEYRIKFGMFSFYNIKDFDFDFYSTSYNKMPMAELYKYFYVPNNMDLIKSGVYYKVIGTGTIEYNGHEINAIDFAPRFQPNIFIGVNGKLNYTVITGSPIIIYSDYSRLIPFIGSIPLTDVPVHDENKDIKSFDGFFSIRDQQLASAGIGSTYEYKDKFLLNILNSEYDYYKENSTKDYSLRSKLVPFISKWGYVGGMDCRDNPYRLNTHPVFGINNFGPNHYDNRQSSLNFTHEWPYLISNNGKDNEALRKINYSNFYTGFNINDPSFDPLKYFTYIPTLLDETTEVGDAQHRYSIIKYNKNTGFNETLFRGAKIRFKDAVSANNYNTDGSLKYKDNSKRFDNYRFSVIYNFKEESLENNEQTYNSGGYKDTPYKINIIDLSSINPAWNFIIMQIDVYVASLIDRSRVYSNYNAINDILALPPDDKLSGLMSKYMDNPDTLTESIRLFMDGDYRTIFTDNISDMTYAFLYSVKNKKMCNAKDLYSTIRMFTNFDFTTNIMTDTILLDKNINYNNELFDENLSTIFNNTDIPCLLIGLEPTGLNVFAALEYNGAMLTMNDYHDHNVNPINMAYYNNLLLLRHTYTDAETTKIGLFDSDKTFMYILPTPVRILNMRQLLGGLNYYQTLFSDISFASLKSKINTYSKLIEYSASNPFYIEIMDDTDINKTSAIVTLRDDEIPDSFKSNDVIGYKFGQVPINSTYTLNRYAGGYEPIFKDVVKFRTNAEFAFITEVGSPSIPSPIFLGNVIFRTDASEFGKLMNFSHLKIADTKILQLADDDKFLPTFEMINEIAIGQADYNIFNSNWDPNYHLKYLTNKDYVKVPGTLRIKDDDAFVNKVLLLPNEISIDTIDIIDLSATVTDIMSIDIDDYKIVYIKNNNGLDCLINIANIIEDTLINMGIEREFNNYIPAIGNSEYIGKLTLHEYVREYIKQNIIQAYDMTSILVYMKKYLDNKARLTMSSIIESDRANLNYELIKDVEINKLDKYIIKLRYNTRPNYGVDLSPNIKIKLI